MSEQKTVREWGEELLPEPYKSQFMANLGNPECNPNPEYKSEKTYFLSNAFDWDLTPDSQGWQYWDDVDDWVDGIGELPEVKKSPRQQSEALLMEFIEFASNWSSNPSKYDMETILPDFLNQKYGS